MDHDEYTLPLCCEDGEQSSSLAVPCFECYGQAVFNHHVIPRAKGGKKTVPLCATCHGKVHGIPFSMHHPTLIRQGLARARAAGRHPGRPLAIRDALLARIKHALSEGTSKAEICRVFRVKRTTLYDALKRSPS